MARDHDDEKLLDLCRAWRLIRWRSQFGHSQLSMRLNAFFFQRLPCVLATGLAWSFDLMRTVCPPVYVCCKMGVLFFHAQREQDGIVPGPIFSADHRNSFPSAGSWARYVPQRLIFFSPSRCSMQATPKPGQPCWADPQDGRAEAMLGRFGVVHSTPSFAIPFLEPNSRPTISQDLAHDRFSSCALSSSQA